MNEPTQFEKSAVIRIFVRLNQPFVAMIFSFAVYGFVAWYHDPLLRATPLAYFNYLADAFLFGQLNLRVMPPIVHDLIWFNGKLFLYWPPFPAIALMPIVVLFGVGASDVVYTLVIAALNVFFVTLFLQHLDSRGIIRISGFHRATLSLFFALGTVHVTVAPFGKVWFTSQLMAFLCVIIAYNAAVILNGWPAFICTGCAIGCAALTRSHLLFAGIWPAYYLINRYKSHHEKLYKYIAAGLTPALCAIGLYMIYNLLRFGNPFDNGYSYHLMSPFFKSDFERYGAFNLHYLPTNFFYQYLKYPFPLSKTTFMGGSLFLLSPLFFGAIWACIKYWRNVSLWWMGVTILTVNIPILLLMGTGWVQFGPRYTLDFTVPLLMLTSMGIAAWPHWLSMLLVLISVIHYLAGTFLLINVM
jgi:hypothetical protein